MGTPSPGTFDFTAPLRSTPTAPRNVDPPERSSISKIDQKKNRLLTSSATGSSLSQDVDDELVVLSGAELLSKFVGKSKDQIYIPEKPSSESTRLECPRSSSEESPSGQSSSSGFRKRPRSSSFLKGESPLRVLSTQMGQTVKTMSSKSQKVSIVAPLHVMGAREGRPGMLSSVAFPGAIETGSLYRWIQEALQCHSN